jgi:hypothetical protein
MRPLLPLLLLALVARLSATEPLELTTPAWDFAAAEGWSVWWPDAAKPKPFTLESVQGGLRLTIAASAEALAFNLWSERFKSRAALGAPLAVALDVELVAGEAAVGLDIYDAEQEGLHFADRMLAPGRQTLTFAMSEKPQHSWGEHRNLIPDPPLALWGIPISRAASATPTVLLLHAGMRHERAHASELVSVRLDTGSAIHLLAPGAAPALVFANRATVAAAVTITVSDEDWAGTISNASASLTVPASSSLRWPLPEAPRARGIHWIECAITDAGDAEVRVRERLPYAILDAPVVRASDQGFLFGVVGGLPGEGEGGADYLDRAVETIRWLGLRNLRSGVNWEYVESAPGHWDEARLAWFSRAIDRFAAIGTRIQFLLCYTTRYAAAKDKQESKDHLAWMFSPPDLEAWRRYVAKMVTLYGDRVRLWEAWNEADIEFWRGSIEQYEQLLHVTYEEVKRGDAQRKVMNSGFAFAWPRNGNPIAEVPYRVAKESRKDYDILAYHLHHQFGEYRHIVEGPLAAIRKQAGDPPLLFNECAVNLDVFGERGQAEQLPKKLLFAWSQGAIGYYWYNLTGGARRPVPGHDANWGLMTDDFHPRAVFCSYHALMGLLADAAFAGRLPTAAERYAFRFTSAGAQVVAAWDEDVRASSEPLVLAVGESARCHLVDLMGVRHAAPCAGGICLMPVGRTPGYLLIEGASSPVELRPTVIHLEPGLSATPGRTTVVHLGASNPLARPATLRLSWSAPAAFRAPGEQSLALPPLATRALELPLTLAAGTSLRLGESASCTLTLAIEGTGLAATVPVPVLLVPSLPEGRFDRPADITLAERASVVNLHANVPQREHRLWRGPEDLSAEAWIGRQGDRLALRVVVRDDKHVQNHAAADAWQGDSVQVAVAVPGAAGFWEFILARDGGSGAPLIANSIRPTGAADAAGQTTLTTGRSGDRTTYEASWPLAALGLSVERLHAGIAIDLLVNDDDGEGRNGWIELSPGLGYSKDPSRFPMISLE